MKHVFLNPPIDKVIIWVVCDSKYERVKETARGTCLRDFLRKNNLAAKDALKNLEPDQFLWLEKVLQSAINSFFLLI